MSFYLEADSRYSDQYMAGVCDCEINDDNTTSASDKVRLIY